MANRKLKVFQAQLGFYDTIVAAASQTAALRAWGTHQDLFASGQAKVTTEDAAVLAATAHPETPLLRAVGSNDAFALNPTSLPKLPDAHRRTAGKPAEKTKSPHPTRLTVDRSRLNAAEAALRDLDERRKREEGDLRRLELEMQARRSAAQGAYVKARQRAMANIRDTKTSSRHSGGED